jgi:dipeptidase E
MKLVLYSGGQSRSNHRLHEAVVRLARIGKPKSKPLQLTYIPFCADASSVYFHRAMRRYRAHGIERFFCLQVDEPHSKDEVEMALKSDVIYLAGGNTFYFLKHLRASGMLGRLKEFAEKGGVLAGLSAGGLIMSPTIASAGEPGLNPDDNEVGLKDLRAMGLVQFEFSPHYEGTKAELRAHLEYSTRSPYPIYASPDGGGLIIHDETLTVCGDAALFYQGTLIRLAK